MNIKIGQKLPNFTGQTFDGQEIDLAKLAGESNVVLYFYPKDDTSGCTVEGIEFSELNKEFRKLNTWVFGMSRDNLDSHQRFCHKHNIHLSLLSDAEGKYGQKLGILKETGSFKRTTILAGRDGKIKHIWENVKANGHAQEVLSKVKELEHQAQKKLALGKDLGPARRNYQKPGQRAASRSKFRKN
ncbi:MAG: peroxiredoxin [Parcubacteria group bacterium]|nr:peroxiredoxin [Parcubacteria group bacterium]